MSPLLAYCLREGYGVSHLFFYHGFGGHLGYTKWNKDKIFINDTTFYKHRYHKSPIFGIDGLLGIEYRFYKYPLSVSIEKATPALPKSERTIF